MKREVFVLIWVNGKQLTPALSRQVRSLSMTFPKNKGATGKLTILDPDFVLFDSNLFRKKQRIAFLCGWKHELVPVGPFIVKNYTLDCPNTGEVSLVVDFQDNSHKMNKKQKQKRWIGSPTAILKQIAEKHNLGYDIDEVSDVEFTEEFPLIQANMTDAALIQRLAWRYGFVWGVYGNNLVFKTPADLEDTGEQAADEIPVLRYRHGDYSLNSFQPAIKFSKGGRRKSAKIFGKNINLTDPDQISDQIQAALEGMTTEELQENLGDLVGDFDSTSVMDDMQASFGEVGAMFGLEGDQDADDERTDATDKKLDEQVSYFLNEFEGTLKEFSKKPKDNDEENTESDVGNSSGTASSSNPKESVKKQAGKIVRASEITSGNAKPTIASMYYRPRMAVVLAGIGKRLSGKYEVSAVDQIISGESDIFETELKVMKRKFGPSPKHKKKIAKSVDQEPPVPGTEDTSSRQPGPPRYYLNDLTGKIKKKVSGSRNSDPKDKKTATVKGS